MAKSVKSAEIDVVSLKQGEMTCWLLGLSPFYCNRVAEKAKRELLFPRGRMTAGQKASSMKHDPIAEYRASPYLRRGDGETRIMMAATAIKKAVAQCAIDMPTSVARTQINRLVYVVDEFIPIFGIPRLAMDVVRMADIGRTPDIRTRARIERWATRITLRFIEPMLSETKVATLLAGSGLICGIGDWRQERGSASNGLYQMVSDDDPLLMAVIAEGGMVSQDDALLNPICANSESEDLLQWFTEERERRGRGEKPIPEDEEDDTIEVPPLGNGEDRTEVVV